MEANRSEDDRRSVFVFNAPKDALNSDQIRELALRFNLKIARWGVPINPQTYACLYLSNEDKPAGFSQPRTFNYDEVISNDPAK